MVITAEDSFPPLNDNDGWARFWFYIVGVNVLPQPTMTRDKTKFTNWRDWQNKPIPEDTLEEWIKEGKFRQAEGMCIILGKVWRGEHTGKYLWFVDCDNKKMIDELLAALGHESLEDMAKDYIVEQHKDDHNRAHVYGYSDIPLAGKGSSATQNKEAFDKNELPACEVKSLGEEGVAFCTPSLHKDGDRYVIIGAAIPKILTEEEAKELMFRIDTILKKYGIEYLEKSRNGKAAKKQPVEELFKEGAVIYAGNNRHNGLLKMGMSIVMSLRGKVPLSACKEIVFVVINGIYCEPPLDRDEFESNVWPSILRYIPFHGKYEELAIKYMEAAKKVGAELAATIETTAKINTEESVKNSAIHNDDYFEYLIQCTEKTVKEENPLIRKTHYTIFSAYTPNPINLAPIAPTAAGKTYTIMQCAQYGPLNTEIIIVGSMSPKTLVRQHGQLVDKDMQSIGKEVKELKIKIKEANAAKDYFTADEYKTELTKLLAGSAYLIDLRNKTFLFLEPPHPELWNIMKPILSHDAEFIEHPYVEKTASGGLEVKRIITQGAPACIFCSAKDESKHDAWSEIQSRFMVTSPNMVKAKYEAGNVLIGKKRGLLAAAKQKMIISDEDRELAKNCFTIIENQIKEIVKISKEDTVWIPYEEILAAALPANKGIDNRNTDRLFSIITMSALCKAHLRQRVVFGGYTQIIATLEDLKEALLLMRNATGIPTHKVNFYYDYILPLYKQKKKVASEGSKVYLTSREIADHYNKEAPKKEGGYAAKINTDAVTRTYLDELVTNSYLQKDEMPLDKRKYSYEPLVGFEEEEKVKEENRARTQEKISKLSQSAFCDNFSHIPKLPLPRNYKEIPKNWLKIKIQSEKNSRSELTDFQIFRNLVSEEAVTEEQFIEEYEKTHKLSHFFENAGVSDCGIETKPKTENSAIKPVDSSKEIIKNEEKEKEKLPQKGNCDNFDILNTNEDTDNLGDRPTAITLCKEGSVAVDLEWDNRPGADDRLLQFNFKDHTGKKWVLNAKRDFNDSEANLLEAAVETVRNYSVVFTYYEKGITLGFGVWDKRAKALGKMSPIFMGYRKDGANSRIDLVNKKGFQMTDIDFGQIYEQPAIQNWLGNIYASNELSVVSQAILKRGKTEDVKGKDFPSLPLEVQVEYGIQDADLTFDLASNNKFLILEILDYLAKFVEMPLEEVCNSGPNRWWESYYKNVMHVEPSSNAIKKNVGEKYEGGDVVKVKEVKEYRNVVVLDFKQQYPSLAKAKNVSFDTINCGHLECVNDQKAKIITGQPEIDTKGYYTCRKEKGSYPKALEVLTELRDNYKAEYKKALAASDTEKAHEFDVKQNTMKIVSNTGYGVFGESHFAYGDVRTAEIITALGRTKVNKLKELIESDKFPNLTNIYRDTDSAFVLGIEGQLSIHNTTVKKILEQANKLEEEDGLGIPLEYEKWYSKVLIYAAKNYMGVNGETGELVVKGLVGKKSNQCELVKDAFKQVREFWKNDVDNATIEAYIKPIIESLDNKTVDIEKLEERSKIGYDPITGYESSPKRPEKVLGMKYNKRVNESITFWHKVKNGKDDYYFTENTAEIDYEHYKQPLRTALKPILTVRDYSAEQIDELLNITPKLSTKKPRKNCKMEENN